jgi:hypothetical protein
MTLIEHLIFKYKNKGIIVDTNLLILLFIGSYSINEIMQNKRTMIYTKEDYLCLKNFLSKFKLITTPNIITETTNLCDTFNKNTSYRFFTNFSIYLKQHFEFYIESNSIIDDISFHKFGLSDSVIYFLSQRGYLVLTDDFPFYGFLISKELIAINFNHLRTEYMIK